MSKKLLIFDGIKHPIALKICDALTAMGLDSHYYDPKQSKQKAFYKYINSFNKRRHGKEYYYHPKVPTSTIEQLFAQQRPDLVLVIGFSFPYISQADLLKLKQQYGFQLLLWDTDSVLQLDDIRKLKFYLQDELPRYDHVYFSSRCMQEFFARHGIEQSSFLPFAATARQKPQPEEKTYDLCFVGDPDMRRLFCLEKLSAHNLIVYGKRWERYLPIASPQLASKIVTENIYGDKLTELTRSSRIVLNITKPLSNSLETGITDRIFEVMACGTFILSDHCAELESIFKIGDELVSFDSSEDMQQKVSYYLHHPELREQVCQKAWDAIQAQHLWQHRVQAILSNLV